MVDKPLGIGIPSITIPGFTPMERATQTRGIMAAGNPDQSNASKEIEDLGLRGSIRDNAREGTLQETLDKIQSDPANAINAMAIQ